MIDKTPQEPPCMEITKAEHQWLVRLGNEIKTQDNAGTSDPVFCVQEELYPGPLGLHWATVQMFFTRKEAIQYMKAYGHDLRSPRIYVASAYSNPQWKRLRAFFLKFADEEQLAADPDTAAPAEDEERKS